jgi:UDP-3-O-[3-hydroxymyristoyl] glucosamine N-acyltransferase
LSRNSYKLSEIADLVGGELKGNGDTIIRGVGGIKEAREGDITYLADPRYASFLASTRASAVIVPPDARCTIPSVRLQNPHLGFLKVMEAFGLDIQPRPAPGVDERAVVDASARIGDNASIGPYCGVGRNVVIGQGSAVMHGSYIGDDTVIGDECLIYPNVTIRERTRIGSRVIIHPGAVIGADGFGFAREGKVHRKIPQVGCVVIEDDVEIGANTTVDRATFGETRICSGVKIDNLVQIAHNVVVGKNSVFAAQSGIAGSTVLGENVTLAGQAGLVGHLEIGDRVVVAAQAGVSNSIKPDTVVSGYPAREHSLARRIYACMKQLPDLFRRVKALEKKVEEGERK